MKTITPLIDLLDEAEIDIMALLIQGVMGSPDGWGEVRVDIRDHKVHLITGTTSVKPKRSVKNLDFAVDKRIKK